MWISVFSDGLRWPLWNQGLRVDVYATGQSSIIPSAGPPSLFDSPFWVKPSPRPQAQSTALLFTACTLETEENTPAGWECGAPASQKVCVLWGREGHLGLLSLVPASFEAQPLLCLWQNTPGKQLQEGRRKGFLAFRTLSWKAWNLLNPVYAQLVTLLWAQGKAGQHEGEGGRMEETCLPVAARKPLRQSDKECSKGTTGRKEGIFFNSFVSFDWIPVSKRLSALDHQWVNTSICWATPQLLTREF